MSGEASPSRESIQIDVRRGTATEEELAALIGVLSEAYAQETAAAVAAEAAPRSAWEVAQRGLRRPLNRHLGWRHGG